VIVFARLQAGVVLLTRARDEMNREQKAATIEELAAEIDRSEAIFAVDYRGISVPGAAELRAKLRDADATFTIVKNSLTERAADQVGAELLKELLTGPTALTFVRGDAALAAKAIADYARATQLLPFKGGLMNGDALDAAQITAISRLPSRQALYGQLVGIVASPVTGLVRTLSALIGGLAVALGQVHEKKASGEIPSSEPPASAAAAPVEEPAAEEPAAEEAPAEEPAAEGAAGVDEPAAEEPAPEEAPAEKPAAEAATDVDEPAAEQPAPEEAPAVEAPAESAGVDEQAAEEPASGEPASEEPASEEPASEDAPAEQATTQDQAEPESEPAQDDNQADASASQPDTAEATKED
jgi:large subunit ribosomal protein L10